MRRVLVTGADGFLGTHCLEALRRRGWNEVHAVSRVLRGRKGANWHACDLFDHAATAELIGRIRPTHLLHLAWCTTPGEYWTSTDNLRWVATSASLFEQFARAGGRRFVGAGTCAEYAWQSGYCSESRTPLRPATPYGAAKNALGSLIEAFGPVFGVSTAWGRVFFPYGPHEHPERLVAYVVRSLLGGTPALCSSGEQQRDFLFAADAGDAFATLLESEFVGVVNIGSGEPCSVRSLVEEIGAQLGRSELVRLGARPSAASEPALLVADVSRLREELGWHPRTSLVAGVKACIAYWTSAGVRTT